MNIDYLINFLGNYAAVIAVALYVAGVVVLVHSMRVQDHLRQAQTTTIADLREHLGVSVEAQVGLHDQVVLLQERCAELLVRQQRLETRGPDSRRIDMAVRMLKRGTGDTRMLQDLGLSNSEAKLLVRLHGTPTGSPTEAPKRQPKAQDRSFATKRQPLAAQGRALAQMLEA